MTADRRKSAQSLQSGSSSNILLLYRCFADRLRDSDSRWCLIVVKFADRSHYFSLGKRIPVRVSRAVSSHNESVIPVVKGEPTSPILIVCAPTHLKQRLAS